MKISKKKAYIFKMNLWTANIFSIAVFVIMAIITILLIGYTAIFKKPFILTLIIIYFAIHELLHGIGYFIGGTKLKNISYGIALEKGIFYCMGYQEITKKNILISLQMPFMVIGVITYIIGIIFKLRVLTWLSVFNIMGAAMDMAMFIFISGIKNVHYSESGKPDEFVLITDEDLTKKKSIFLVLKETKDYKKEDYEFKDIKRFKCSKSSWIALLVLLGLDLINIILG